MFGLLIVTVYVRNPFKINNDEIYIDSFMHTHNSSLPDELIILKEPAGKAILAVQCPSSMKFPIHEGTQVRCAVGKSDRSYTIRLAIDQWT